MPRCGVISHLPRLDGPPVLSALGIKEYAVSCSIQWIDDQFNFLSVAAAMKETNKRAREALDLDSKDSLHNNPYEQYPPVSFNNITSSYR